MSASDLRARARQSLTNHYWNAVLVAFVAAIFGAWILGGGFSIDFEIEEITDRFGRVPTLLTVYLAVVGFIASVISLPRFILGGVVQMGYAKYLLGQHDGQEGSVKDLFSMFDYFKAGFLQALLRGIFVFLWSLLFIIPGIIKGLSYSMTPFILAENPNMTAREAINASKVLMDGHKGELFWLDLTFIGWELLCALTGGIGTFFLAPYKNAAYAAFYRDITHPNTVTAEPVVEF